MGKDEHKTGSNNSKSLPQTPKNQKIKPGNLLEEIAKEFLTIEPQQMDRNLPGTKQNKKRK